MSPTVTDNSFTKPTSADSRAPCPALNALANHSYLPPSGRSITFTVLMSAIANVYNMSLPLAFLLSLAGFLSVGRISFARRRDGSRFRLPHWELDLEDLCTSGKWKIAHKYSLGHSDPVRISEKQEKRTWKKYIVPPRTDVELIRTLASYAGPGRGLSLDNLSKARAIREMEYSLTTNGNQGNKDSAMMKTKDAKLSRAHSEIARGEAGLIWLVLKDDRGEVSVGRLMEWFGVVREGGVNGRWEWTGERLPDGWWNGVRPKKVIGIRQARRAARAIKQKMENIRETTRGTYDLKKSGL